MNGWIRVVKWEEFQHYKDRDPVWIKLHRSVLDNYEWARLQDASKSHLIGIWLLAARHNNRIPADPAWIGTRIGATTPVDLQVLAAAGFIEMEQDASKTLATCYVEKRREETEQLDSGGVKVPPELTNPDHRDAYVGFLRGATNPTARAASIAAVAVGMPGHGPGYGWPVVGQALQEMAAGSVRYTDNALLGFARKVRDRPPATRPRKTITDDLGRDVLHEQQADGSWRAIA